MRREIDLMERIRSRQNPMVREAAALLKSSDRRRESGLFLCEGARLCEDAARSGVELVICFVTDGAVEKYDRYLKHIFPVCPQTYLIEDHVAGLLSSTKSPQGVFCVCKLPKALLTGVVGFAPARSCLVLENVQDPGNLGTILRTAEALGVSRVFLLGEGCDPFSPKALRASMGAVFRLSIVLERDSERLRALLAGHGYTLHAAVPDSSALPVTEVDFSQGLHAIYIGNEGNGLTEKTISLCHDRITIPMEGRAESLNASAAANILLWELCRKGRGHHTIG